MLRFEEVRGWGAKAKCLVDWRREVRTSTLNAFSDEEYYLYNRCEDELFNYYTEDYTEEDAEWYESCIVKIDDEYVKSIKSIRAN